MKRTPAIAAMFLFVVVACTSNRQATPGSVVTEPADATTTTRPATTTTAIARPLDEEWEGSNTSTDSTIARTTDTTLPDPTTSTTSTTQATTTTEATTTTSPEASADLAVPGDDLTVLTARELEVAGGLPMDVFYPDQPGPWPVAMVIHGGGWVSGQKENIEGFAKALAGRGTVVFSAEYRPVDRSGSFPEAFQEITCALYAAAEAAPAYEGQDGTITVVGYSAGAHIGSVSVLASSEFNDGCGAAATQAAGFAGISGPYDSDKYVLVLPLMFGVLRDDDPDVWATGNPYTYLGRNPDLRMLLLHGGDDPVVGETMTTGFHTSVTGAGYDAGLQIYDGVGHFDITDPSLAGAQTADDVAAFVRSVATGS